MRCVVSVDFEAIATHLVYVLCMCVDGLIVDAESLL